jgi:hypothetical protein
MTKRKLMKKLYFVLSFLLLYCQGRAQVIYGVNNYIQYHIGTLPIIISAPHGGLVAPASIPDRTCNSPTTVTDNNTIELARQIDTALFNKTGCRPHLIICNLKRTKIDCNRNLADGACGNIDAENAWTEFSHFIDTAQFMAKNQYFNKVFYIDLHGHGHTINNLELGYGISINNLNNTDIVLNTPSVIATSSINNLVNTNVSGSTHAQLIRGTNSLGTLFGNATFPAVPSQQIPGPGTDPYFIGGYNTSYHTCVLPGNVVNGLQIEAPSTVRNNYLNRKRFADSTASILVKYILIHQNLNLQNNCGIAVLPIELVVFSGKAFDKKNILFWKTLSEANNDYFTLYKSADGIDFEPIAKIKGAGNSSQELNYSFEDTHLTEPRNYYKLEQTDFDGHSKYSKVIQINNSLSEISIFPNYVTDVLNISIGNNKGNYQVTILNSIGQIIHNTKNQNNINISNLTSGLYFVYITFDNQNSWSSKIIKE